MLDGGFIIPGSKYSPVLLSSFEAWILLTSIDRVLIDTRDSMANVVDQVILFVQLHFRRQLPRYLVRQSVRTESVVRVEQS